MKKFILFIAIIGISSPCFAQTKYQYGTQGPVKENVYGLGVHEDSTGRPFIYKTQDNQQTFGPVKRDGYGQGVHIDQYGRPVYDSTWPK